MVGGWLGLRQHLQEKVKRTEQSSAVLTKGEQYQEPAQETGPTRKAKEQDVTSGPTDSSNAPLSSILRHTGQMSLR